MSAKWIYLEYRSFCFSSSHFISFQHKTDSKDTTTFLFSGLILRFFSILNTLISLACYNVILLKLAESTLYALFIFSPCFLLTFGILLLSIEFLKCTLQVFIGAFYLFQFVLGSILITPTTVL